MDFATLKSRLLSQIGRAPSDLCYELVTAEINESVRLSSMQAVTTFGATEAQDLPADYLEAVSVYVDYGGDRMALSALEPTQLDVHYRNGSAPQFYAVSDGVMRFSGGGGSGTISLRYYQSQADLALDEDTNSILTDHPSIYTYGVLAHHAALTKDPEALSVWFPAYERAMGKARSADNAKRMGGLLSGPMRRVAP